MLWPLDVTLHDGRHVRAAEFLFSDPDAFLPSAASMPYDLVVTGNIAPALQLSPASTTLAVTEGATQTR